MSTSLGSFDHTKKLSRFFLLITILFYACSPKVAQVAVTPSPVISADTIVAISLRPGIAVAVDSAVVVKTTNSAQIKTLAFYKNHAFKTHWLLDNQPSPLYGAVENMLLDAGRYGLRSGDYNIAAIQEKVRLIYSSNSIDPKAIADLDRYITEMVFRFTTHVGVGKITDVASGRSIWMQGQRIDRNLDVDWISRASTPEELVATVQNLQPSEGQYAKLQQALAYYRALESAPSISIDIVKGIKVKPEERHAIIATVRKKLSLTDSRPYAMVYDSATASFDSLRYDATLVSAVKWFQVRHGLEADGVIGEKTLRFLNQSFREKADIIALNMERLRWSRDKYGENYIFVNVPDYTLRVFENKKPALEMRVIVGAVDKPTPIFSDALEYIIFSPTWSVPTSIIREEIIPRLRANPAYYADKNYAFYKGEVAIDPTTVTWDESANPYEYRIVQQPGPDNSLGLVKFIMPNNMSVYLHDTPNHRLFSKDYRALSHGCVRLNEPARFASFLLRDQKGWDQDRIRKAMNGKEPSTVHLRNKYDVHIEYFTAWVDENDTVQFREDIYGHDKRQLQQLYPKEKAGDLAGL